ncbi:MAG: undecaprenyl-diphosphatase UppP [bacterium]|nr:undecaprenyl-diphosphatase UppP [bacterium]
MDLFQAFVLGAVQGITEYLPVSSSAHLVLVPQILGWHFDSHQAFIFDVLVQLGTLVGVIVYFAKDLWQISIHMWRGLLSKKPLGSYEARLGWLVVLATIPAAFAGVFFKSEVEVYFSSPKAVMVFLLITAGLLIVAEFFGRKKGVLINNKEALSMGFAQCLALLPGISRSGTTIVAGVLTGLSKESAARFSFLMSIPILFGASLVAGKDLLAEGDNLSALLGPLLVGGATAAISGYLVIRWFLNFLKTQSMLWFALYCALVGGVGLIIYG